MDCLIVDILILSLLIVIHLSMRRASTHRQTECVKQPVEDLHLTPEMLADLPGSADCPQDATDDLSDALQRVRWLR